MKRLVSLLTLLLPLVTWSQDQGYVPLSDLPLTESISPDSNGLTAIIDMIYLASIGIAAAISVIVLIFAGMQLALSSSANGRSKWKDRVSGAFLGLILLVGAFLLLYTINPQLTELNIEGSKVTVNGRTSGENIGIVGVVVTGTAGLAREDDGSYSPDPEGLDDYILNNLEGAGVGLVTDGTGYVKDGSGDAVGAQEQYASQEECGNDCAEASNPYTPVTTPPTINPNDSTLVTSRGKAKVYWDLPLTAENVRGLQQATGQLWPVNPWRRPKDFVDCISLSGKAKSSSTGNTNVTPSFVKADRFMMDELNRQGLLKKKTKNGATLPIRFNSTYRSRSCSTGGTRQNHPYGASADYELATLTTQDRVKFQQIALRAGALRMGFGQNFYHIQFDGRGTGPNKYWCYSSTPNPKVPFGGIRSMPKKWSTCYAGRSKGANKNCSCAKAWGSRQWDEYAAARR